MNPALAGFFVFCPIRLLMIPVYVGDTILLLLSLNSNLLLL